ncbi:hypothetical protein PF005_g7005 [Phytophthora fragariae]|uniref:Uncharacterized protein n=1 Tax=Phytophthora fragariae TaxID=53985 RepID=A0A6A3KWR2_9STRA|nr:hypothetical protein PF011_g9185 [Phytophthora fragariae]KAE9110926.1 hypothetical protein PF010_g11002 [Phytophthora fragariae]KAE9116306.1 hypothetical protein PF007_g9711 [Phytophthora fragariae]KAE9145435.1 hypothetical protein PF006_g9713 [Phytophthora fragariae]KAE9221665.1 hypothetical protein PF005_g7005 [Phytophthora fragariae]
MGVRVSIVVDANTLSVVMVANTVRYMCLVYSNYRDKEELHVCDMNVKDVPTGRDMREQVASEYNANKDGKWTSLRY